MVAPAILHLWTGWPHVLRAQQFDPASLDRIFREARLAEEITNSGGSNLLKGKIVLTLFYEPSTRTRLSFEFATYHLGGRVLSSEAAREFSSAAKGESIEDTIRVVSRYRPAAIVLRHYQEGAAERAAAAAADPRNGRPIPVFNAGDGPGQHPTQALLDAYTIWRSRGTLEGVTVAAAGDLLNGRTARSLCYLLAKYRGVSFRLIAPRPVQMKDDILAYLRRHKVPFIQTEDLGEGVREADVLYVTRIQKERFAEEEQDAYERIRNTFCVTADILAHLPPNAIVMHPLPRVEGPYSELPTSVEADPRVIIFDQTEAGMYVRMALLKLTCAVDRVTSRVGR
ncbi:MAG TPA: aspartate carbamoyltransferase [bacterium]|nr:aspartate carbamoyltransferase [bacterium]